MFLKESHQLELLMDYEETCRSEDSLEAFVFKCIQELGVFYRSIDDLALENKLKAKELYFNKIVFNLFAKESLSIEKRKRIAAKIRLQKNAFFTSYKSYNNSSVYLSNLLSKNYQNNLQAFIRSFMQIQKD